MRQFISLILFLFLSSPVFCQVVNIEGQRIQSDTTGWLGGLGTGFLFEKNVVEVININVNAHLEYKTQKNLYLFLVNYNFLKGSGQTFNNNLFYHLRYNYKVNDLLRWEVFTQMQQNNVTGIKFRLLAGTGPRFKLSGSNKLALYAGTSFMYEDEKEKTQPVIHHKDLRSSNYATTTYKPSDATELIATIFYQPLYKIFNDYRILNELTLKIKVAKKLSFTTGWYFLYDSKPAASAPNRDYSISNGIEYNF